MQISMKNKIMWICVADEMHFDENSLATTRKESIRRLVERAQAQAQPDLEWNDLKFWGYKCVKVIVKFERI